MPRMPSRSIEFTPRGRGAGNAFRRFRAAPAGKAPAAGSVRHARRAAKRKLRHRLRYRDGAALSCRIFP